MKIFHLSDLHLGKRINEFSMLDEQQNILDSIITYAETEKPNAVIIAGDVYDKTIPPAEAVELFDKFLTNLSNLNIKVLVISGNHDSAERIAFGGKLMNESGVFMSPVFQGEINPVTLNDEYGKVNFFMLPFIKPSHVRAKFPNDEISSYTDAIKIVIDHMNINYNERNILITHQFVTGATRCDSEEISVGGSDNVDATIFSDFDYVALGHIHSPQNIGNKIRYCGTPLKYSFSECSHKKSITVVTILDKENLSIETLPLTPINDMCEIKGNFDKITSKEYYQNINTNDYIHVILTDEDDVFDALNKLRRVYPNIMKLDYDNARTRKNEVITSTSDIEKKSPLTLFSEFFKLQNNKPISEEQTELLKSLIEQIWEGE